jgi:hypothetical protein
VDQDRIGSLRGNVGRLTRSAADRSSEGTEASGGRDGTSAFASRRAARFFTADSACGVFEDDFLAMNQFELR